VRNTSKASSLDTPGDKKQYVPHRFRSSFRDWTGEVTIYPRDVAEIALAHTIENKVEAAYRCGDLCVKRKAAKQELAEYVLPVKSQNLYLNQAS
jgi:hypothetical protein